MKLLSVKFKNLNSLRGENAIDFMVPPISDTGLFAITGDTGSGKTTILDAITLGLYGKVHRNKKAEHIMSYGSADCFSEVEFAVKSEIYRARWWLGRAYNKADGKLQKVKRELARRNKNGEFDIIAEQIKECDKKIESITGLDFGRFTRSVILAQGDFAAFLKADEKQRSELLEQITGTEIYSKLSIAAHEREREEKSKLENLRARQEGMHLLEEEEVAKLNEEQKDVRQTIGSFEKELLQLTEQLQKVKNYNRLNERKKEFEDKEKALREELKVFQADIQRLELYKKALPMQAEITRIDDLIEVIRSLTNENSDLTKSIAQVISAEEKAANLYEKNVNKLAALKAENAEKTKIFDRVIKLDVAIQGQMEETARLKKEVAMTQAEKTSILEKIGALNEYQKRLETDNQSVQTWLVANDGYKTLAGEMSGIEAYRVALGTDYIEQEQLKEEISTLEKEMQAAEEGKKSLKSEFDKQEKNIQRLKAKFETITDGNRYEDYTAIHAAITKELEAMVVEKQQAERIAALNGQFKNHAEELERYETQLKSLEKDLTVIDNRLKEAEKIHEKLTNDLDYKRRTWEHAKTVAKYDADRHELTDGEPCPVCFSTHHPFREMDLEPYNDRAKKEFLQVEKDFSESEKKRSELLRKQMELTHKISVLTGDGLDLLGQIPTVIAKIAVLQKQLVELGISGFDHFPLDEQQLNRHVVDIDNIHNKLNSQRAQLTSLVEELMKDEKAFQTVQEELRRTDGNLQRQKDAISHTQKELKSVLDKFAKAKKELNAKLKPYGHQFEIKTGKATFDKLKEMSDLYVKQAKRADELTKQLELIARDADHHEKSKKSIEKVLEKNSQAFEKQSKKLTELQQKRHDLYGKADPETEKRQLAEAIDTTEAQKDKEKQTRDTLVIQLKTLQNSLTTNTKSIETKKTAFASRTKSLTGKAKKAGFNDLHALKNAILEESQAKHIETRKQQLENNLLTVTTHLKSTLLDLEKLVKTGVEAILLTELIGERDEKQTQISELQQKSGAINEKLKENERLKKEAIGLIKQIEKQRKEYNIWAMLKSLIGQADGQKFRIFAQGLTLRKLVSLANQHLRNLDSRYIIYKPNEDSLRLMIIDTFQAGNKRSMETLSGGESFLVSLALAMGLSNMAGGNTEIGSLFIDEGFGTLDQATLDMAISTLENLHAGGKTIGVVSHVKELKERISTQIQVKKVGGGVSELAIVTT